MNWIRGLTIGRGSTATVSTATSQWSGDIFAVKSVELLHSEPLQREQKILSALSSSHIVSYIGYDITKENNKLTYNLMMEYLSGGTLTDEIRRNSGQLQEGKIQFYTHQIVQGLEYLHSKGIAHCDIKCHNILIGESGAKIADFGCAKWNDDVAAIGGTPMYMAPEVARGEEQGYPADIWALGCTIIEMATGNSPWPNFTDPVSVLHRIAFSGESPELPDFLSKQTKDFLGKCLRRDPKERWTAKQLLKHPFLGELKCHEKQTSDSNFNSPTSILDQSIWGSIEESGSDLGDVNPQNFSSSSEKLIGLFSGEPNWKWDDAIWVTVRSNDCEANADCGSVTALMSDDMEMKGSVNNGEEVINISDSSSSSICSCSCSNSVSSNLMVCTEEHRVVITCSLSFERDREEELSHIQSQLVYSFP